LYQPKEHAPELPMPRMLFFLKYGLDSVLAEKHLSASASQSAAFSAAVA
jgi:hypothetical protein